MNRRGNLLGLTLALPFILGGYLLGGWLGLLVGFGVSLVVVPPQHYRCRTHWRRHAQRESKRKLGT
jgi:hypothetical protein